MFIWGASAAAAIADDLWLADRGIARAHLRGSGFGSFRFGISGLEFCAEGWGLWIAGFGCLYSVGRGSSQVILLRSSSLVCTQSFGVKVATP